MLEAIAATASLPFASGADFQPVSPARQVTSGRSWPEDWHKEKAAPYGNKDAVTDHITEEGRTPEERWKRAQLQARDAEVRARETAKGEAVAGHAYTWQAGPDGRLYAVGSKSHLVKRDENDPQSVQSRTEDQSLTRRLEERDALVRSHEQAHVNNSGGLADPLPQYDTQVGPDGEAYAIGGSVGLRSVSVPGNAEATRRYAFMLQQAAMGPGSPSAQDFAVAGKAERLSLTV